MKTLFILILLLLVISGVLLYQRNTSTTHQVIFTELAPKPIGPYNQAIRAGEWLFVSGQIALDANGHLDSSSIERETEICLRHLQNILKAGGRELKDVVKCSVFLTNLRDFPKVNKVYETFFPSQAPARETLGVNHLPKGAHIEISAIAH